MLTGYRIVCSSLPSSYSYGDQLILYPWLATPCGKAMLQISLWSCLRIVKGKILTCVNYHSAFLGVHNFELMLLWLCFCLGDAAFEYCVIVCLDFKNMLQRVDVTDNDLIDERNDEEAFLDHHLEYLMLELDFPDELLAVEIDGSNLRMRPQLLTWLFRNCYMVALPFASTSISLSIPITNSTSLNF